NNQLASFRSSIPDSPRPSQKVGDIGKELSERNGHARNSDGHCKNSMGRTFDCPPRTEDSTLERRGRSMLLRGAKVNRVACPGASGPPGDPKEIALGLSMGQSARRRTARALELFSSRSHDG